MIMTAAAAAMAGCRTVPPVAGQRFDPDEWLYWPELDRPERSVAAPPADAAWSALSSAERARIAAAWQALDPESRAAVGAAWATLDPGQRSQAIDSMRRRADAGILQPVVPAGIADEHAPSPRLRDYQSFGGGRFRRGGSGLLP
jgi:hypothetical protein